MTPNARPSLDHRTAPVTDPGDTPVAIAGLTRGGRALGDGCATNRSPTCGRDRARAMSRAETWAFDGGDAVRLDLRADQTPTPAATPAGPAADGGPLTPERVFHEHLPCVYHLARRLLGHDADAEDVTQDVLLQVVRRLHSFRGEAEFTTWLHRVIVNAVLLHRRRLAARTDRQTGDRLQQYLHDPACSAHRRAGPETPDQRLLDDELRELLEQAIGRLPEPYRDVYVLADVEGCSNAHIGEVLGLSLAAVKSRLHRARCSRLLTAGTDSPSMSAISAFGNSSTSAST